MRENGYVLALGFFDGVHAAHGALLRRVTQVARELDAVPAAVTFDNHPKTFAGTKPVELLNTPEDRAWLMERLYGIREVKFLPFDRAMMEMPWDRFVREILAERFHAVHVVAGHDYRFGYRGEGDARRLTALCGELGIGCDVIDRVELEGVTVSSTHIRGLVAAGEMEEAGRFLGHPHILSGIVRTGRQVGRTIGIPTANLAVPEGVLVPGFGVYATRVRLEDGRTFLAVTNVGVRPTVGDDRGVTVEPWILDFGEDLYGQTIRVEFHKRLRGERKFASLEELRDEIRRNGEETRLYFQNL